MALVGRETTVTFNFYNGHECFATRASRGTSGIPIILGIEF